MRFYFAAGLILIVAPLLADDQSSPWMRLMDLNVVAVDKSGNPVKDLTSDDFAVSDAGKLQKIAYFRHLADRPAAVPTLASGEFSNRSDAGVSHATAILFDLLNEDMGSRIDAEGQIVRYLGSLESPDDLYLYLLTVDGRLFAVHGLNEETPKAPDAVPWTHRIKPLMDQAMATVSRLRPVDIDVAVRVQITYAAMANLTAELSRIPGHKNIVWITDGVPIILGPRRSDTGDFVDFTPQLRQLSEMLHRYSVTVDPVRQIMLGSPNGPPDAPGVPAADGAGAGMGSEDTLDEFAHMTGGRPNAGKNIAAAIKQATIDSHSSYQLGYYPDDRSWDNKFHKIRVTCIRKGVQIRAREGYYAWQESPDQEALKAVEDASATMSDAAGIGLRGALTPDPKQSTVAHLAVRIDARDLAIARQGDQYTDQLRLAVIGYRADGHAEGSPLIPFDLNYSAQDRDKAIQEGVEFSRNISVGDGFRKLRLVVFDLGSNTVGSLTIPVGKQ